MRFLTNGLSGREPLLIDPAKANDHAVLAEKFGFTDMLAQLFGIAPKPYVTADGVGVIPVYGVIGKGLTPLEKMMGAADVDELSAAVDAFAMNPDVTRIALQVSSPGGTVTGVEELAIRLDDTMVDLDKPVRVVWKDGSVLHEGVAPRSIAVLSTTLAERGDPRGVFSAEVRVRIPAPPAEAPAATP